MRPLGTVSQPVVSESVESHFSVHRKRCANSAKEILMLFDPSVLGTAPKFDKPFLDTVRAAARGNWKSILRQTGVPESALSGKHSPCPGCGGKDRFRFDDREGRGTWICSQGGGQPISGDGFSLLMHVQGLRFPEALRTVAEILGVTSKNSGPQNEYRSKPSANVSGKTITHDANVHRKRIKAVLRHSSTDWTSDGPIGRYLISRGLGDILKDRPRHLLESISLRYYMHDGSYSVHPGMVARISAADGTPLTLHQTFLTEDGKKASVDSVRKILPPISSTWNGGSIQLYEAGPTLALAEGIESALAVRLMTGLPVWSGVTAGGLTHVAVPNGVMEVLIYPDYDDAGLKAAIILGQRLHDDNIDVRVIHPNSEGMDPLDQLLAKSQSMGQSK